MAALLSRWGCSLAFFECLGGLIFEYGGICLEKQKPNQLKHEHLTTWSTYVENRTTLDILKEVGLKSTTQSFRVPEGVDKKSGECFTLLTQPRRAQTIQPC